MMSNLSSSKLRIDIPFPSVREAEIAYEVIKIDAEPPRSTVVRQLSLSGSNLLADFSSSSLKQLRVAVNSYFNKLNLIGETLQEFGPPTSAEYSFK